MAGTIDTKKPVDKSIEQKKVLKKFIEYCKDSEIDYKNKCWLVSKEKVTEKFLTNIITNQFVSKEKGSPSAVELISLLKASKINSAKKSIDGTQYKLNVYKKTYPIITKLSKKWNKVDETFMSNFNYAFDGSGTSVVWFLKNTISNEYTPIYPAQSDKIEKAQLLNVCSSVKTMNRVKKEFNEHTESLQDLWDFILNRFKLEALRCFKRISDKEKCEAAVRKLIEETLPLHAFHNTLRICVVIHQSVESFDGTEVPVEYVKDIVIENKTSSSSNEANVWDYIHNSLRYIQTRKDKRINFPSVYSTDPNEPTMRYVDLKSLAIKGDCPNWDFYLKRFSPPQQRAFMAYIYSIFDSGNTGRQCLYICDNGFTGKSVLTSVIAQYIGERLVSSIQKNSLDNNFGLSKIWDKRLVVIDDNKNKNIIRSEKIHMLLGQGLADIEYKRRDAFTARLKSKLIICGNVFPSINPYATHELTRLILLEPKLNDEILAQISKVDEDGNVVKDSRGKPVLIGDSEFPKKLKKEFPHFLYKCKEIYKELCPTRSNIIIDKELTERLYDMESIVEHEYERLFLDSYAPNHNQYITKSDIYEWFKATINDSSDKEMEFENFTAFLFKRFEIQFKRERIKGTRIRSVCAGWGERGSRENDEFVSNAFESLEEV